MHFYYFSSIYFLTSSEIFGQSNLRRKNYLIIESSLRQYSYESLHKSKETSTAHHWKKWPHIVILSETIFILLQQGTITFLVLYFQRKSHYFFQIWKESDRIDPAIVINMEGFLKRWIFTKIFWVVIRWLQSTITKWSDL